jgi:hypothetical protein
MDLTWVYLSLVFGLLTAMAATVIVIASLMVDPRLGLKDFPPSTKRALAHRQQRVTQPASKLTHGGDPQAEKLRYAFGIPYLLVILAGLVLSTVRLPQVAGHDLTFGLALFNAFTIFTMVYVADLVVLDLLLGMVIRPEWASAPVSETAPAPGELRFHLTGFFKNLLGGLLYSVAFAAFSMAIASVIS